ncbi:AHH domain-containing protein [Flavobacterium sp.]|uniref:AHH domain-containing protein n=1 Tax=Flavobacterium sp. TaxID=239 RepID=UPI0026203DDE|nr:AHH domain-containing protein [Flavobacterium sp.]
MKKLILWTLFIFTAFLWSCEDTELHESHSENKNEISIEQFKEETGITDFPKTLKISNNQNTGRRSMEAPELLEFDIDWELIKKATVDERITYSFRVEPKIVKEKSLFNLVVYHDGLQWQYSLLEIKPDDQVWSDLTNNQEVTLSGSIKEITNTEAANRIVVINVIVDVHCVGGGRCAQRGTCDLCHLCADYANVSLFLPNDYTIMQPVAGPGGGGPASHGFNNPYPTIAPEGGFAFDPNYGLESDKKFTRIQRAAQIWNSLDYGQMAWASNNSGAYNAMMSELLANFNDYNRQNFTNLLSLLSNNEISNISAEALAACVAIEAEDVDELKLVANAVCYANSSGYFADPSNSEHFETFITENQNLFNDPIYWLQVGFRIFSHQCAIIKQREPNISQYRLYAKAYLETCHLILDLGGLVPGFGEICDLVNGTIYTVEGDGVNATLSFASAMPFVGWFSAGVKFARRADNLVYVVVDNLITFGGRNSTAFRKKLGMLAGDSRIAHHIIPRALFYHPAIQKAAQSTINQGFHLDTALNGIPLSTTRHSGSHHQYTQRIYALLNDINLNQTNDAVYNEVLSKINYIKNKINQNSNLNINQIEF